MLTRILRGTLLFVSSVLAIPYTVAIVSNILNGWPQTKNKYRRALGPRKVLGLNYVILQMLRDKARFLPLYLKWKKFYRNADPKRVYKNLAFGRNDCTMDMYLPSDRDPNLRLPVVIFLFGGSWSSGDKNMYGLLCSQIVASTGAIAICPNYSTYPKGYVDDMIQDVVDCISWVLDSIEEYGGDKNKIILVGHSAGAHLGAMAILELLHDERISLQPGFRFQPAGGPLEELAFAESHYGRLKSLSRREGLDDSSGSSESFAVVSDNGSALEQSMGGSLENSGGAASFLGSSMNSDVLDSSANSEALSHSMSASTVMVEAGGGIAAASATEAEHTPSDVTGEGHTPDIGGGGDGIDKPSQSVETIDDNKSVLRLTPKSGSLGDDEEENDDDSCDNDSVVTVRPKDIDCHATLVDMCKAVKAFIGLAGVYSIGDHFQHESMRGIEDVSCMCRAHYGEDHFERFSPTEILMSLGRCLSLPVMVLVHGSDDYIVPVSSTHNFSSALAEISANVKVRIIPDCDHYEVCLGLMESQSKFYSHVMGVIMETVAAVS